MKRTALSALSLSLVVPFLMLVAASRPSPAGIQEPAWLGEVPSLALHSPPFEESMEADGLIRMEVEEGKAYRFRGDGVHAYQLKDGEMVDRSSSAVGAWIYLYHSRAECDEMVFHAREAATLKVEEGPMEERSASAGEILEFPIQPDARTPARFVGLDPGTSTCVYFFYMGEEDVSLAPEDFRTITLEGAGEHAQKTFQVPADRLLVRVTGGQVQVKVGRPFPD